MDFETMAKHWEAQALAPGRVEPEALLVELKREVASAERRLRGAICLTAGLLLLEWSFAFGAHFVGIKPLNPMQVIGHLVASALYTALLARATQSLRALKQEKRQLGGTVRESVHAALRVLGLQIGNARVAAVAIPLVVLGSGLLFAAKALAGDLPGYGAAAGSGFMLIVGAAIGAAFWHRYRTELAPRREQLRAVLRALGPTPEGDE